MWCFWLIVNPRATVSYTNEILRSAKTNSPLFRVSPSDMSEFFEGSTCSSAWNQVFDKLDRCVLDKKFKKLSFVSNCSTRYFYCCCMNCCFFFFLFVVNMKRGEFCFFFCCCQLQVQVALTAIIPVSHVVIVDRSKVIICRQIHHLQSFRSHYQPGHLVIPWQPLISSKKLSCLRSPRFVIYDRSAPSTPPVRKRSLREENIRPLFAVRSRSSLTCTVITSIVSASFSLSHPVSISIQSVTFAVIMHTSSFAVFSHRHHSQPPTVTVHRHHSKLSSRSSFPSRTRSHHLQSFAVIHRPRFIRGRLSPVIASIVSGSFSLSHGVNIASRS